MNSFLNSKLVASCATTALLLPFSISSNAQAPDLDQIVVTGAGIEQPLSNVLPSVTLVTREEIAKSQAPSLADLLQGEPGIEFSRTGGPGQITSFFLRGNQSTSLVIYVDGVKVQTDGYGNLTALNIPLATIDHIEILRGNAGALYGDAAIGGVINIFTRQGGGGDPKAFASVTAGSYNTQEAVAGYGGKVNDTSFNLTFTETTSNGIPSLNTAQYPDANPNNGSYTGQSVNASIAQSINQDLEIGGGVRYLTTNVTYADPNAGQCPTCDGTDSSTTFNMKVVNTDLNVFGKYKINNDWTSRVDVTQSQVNSSFYSNANIDLITQNYGYNTLYGVTNYETQNIQTASKWFNSYKIDGDKTATFGIDYAQAGFDNGLGDSMTRTNQGYYIGYTQKYDSLDLQINGRHDEINVNEQNTGLSSQNYFANTGLFGLGYYVTDNIKLTATTSTAFQAPTAGQIFGYPMAYGANTFNPGLAPETAYSNEIGAAYSSGDLTGRLVYFNTRTTNAIEGQTAPGGGFEFINVPSLQNAGYELSVGAKFYGFSLRGAYTAQNPINESTQQIPQLIAKQFGSVDLSKQLNQFDVGTKVTFSGSRQDNFYAAGSYVGVPQTLNPYQLWSFYAGMKVTEEWTARIRLNNAFNENYQLVSGYNTMGRNVMFTMSYQQK